MLSKPLGRKAYGSIPHLYGSRCGPGDHHCHKGQHDIATVATRDKYDRVIVSEKLDGSNCAVALIDGRLHALTRAGYPALSSPYAQHHHFHNWVMSNQHRFKSVLRDGERVCGEWMMQAHSIRYALGTYEPYFVFDIMVGSERLPWDTVINKIDGALQTVPVIHDGGSLSVDDAMRIVNRDSRAGTYGMCGALEQVEGFVWRIERHGTFSFIAKWVRPDKQDGRYLGDDIDPVWNVTPETVI